MQSTGVTECEADRDVAAQPALLDQSSNERSRIQLASQAELAVQGDPQPLPLGLCRGAYRINGAAHNLVQADPVQVELDFARDDAAHIEQVGDYL
jgi:hypothetical protein